MTWDVPTHIFVLYCGFRSVYLHLMGPESLRNLLLRALHVLGGFRTGMNPEEINRKWIKVTQDHAQWRILADCLCL